MTFGIGNIIFRFIGTIVRWCFKGFKGTWKQVWNGPTSDDLVNGISYEFVSNIIGILVIFLICFLIINVLKI